MTASSVEDARASYPTPMVLQVGRVPLYTMPVCGRHLISSATHRVSRSRQRRRDVPSLLESYHHRVAPVDPRDLLVGLSVVVACGVMRSETPLES